MAKISLFSRLIVSRLDYEKSHDKKFLIPFYQGTKIGFIDKDDNIVISPMYDYVLDDFLSELSVVRVGIAYAIANVHDGQVTANLQKRFGIMKSNGELLFPMESDDIKRSPFSDYFTLHTPKKGFSVIDNFGKVIVPYGKYTFIDGFDSGYARIMIKKVSKGIANNGCFWGIINEKGEEVVPPKYKKIWNFYKNPSDCVIVEGFDAKFEFIISEHKLFDEGTYMEMMTRMNDEIEAYQDYREDETFGEFNGSYAQDEMGYSDNDIYDIFEGDPDAYWNID